MQIKYLKAVLETAKSMQVKSVVIDALIQSSKIRGIDEKGSVVVFSTVEGEPGDPILEADVGIPKVDVLLNRIELFDLDKCSASLNIQGQVARNLELKQGRRRTTYTFATPETIRAPKLVADENTVAEISIDAARFALIKKAQQATAAEFIQLSGQDGEVVIRMFDGVSDAFTDTIGETDSKWSFQWRSDSFIRALKEALNDQDAITFAVKQNGILCIEIGGIDFKIIPQVS